MAAAAAAVPAAAAMRGGTTAVAMTATEAAVEVAVEVVVAVEAAVAMAAATGTVATAMDTTMDTAPIENAKEAAAHTVWAMVQAPVVRVVTDNTEIVVVVVTVIVLTVIRRKEIDRMHRPTSTGLPNIFANAGLAAVERVDHVPNLLAIIAKRKPIGNMWMHASTNTQTQKTKEENK